jgi:hypothetical protein
MPAFTPASSAPAPTLATVPASDIPSSSATTAGVPTPSPTGTTASPGMSAGPSTSDADLYSTNKSPGSVAKTESDLDASVAGFANKEHLSDSSVAASNMVCTPNGINSDPAPSAYVNWSCSAVGGVGNINISVMITSPNSWEPVTVSASK